MAIESGNPASQDAVVIGRLAAGTLSPHQYDVPVLATHTLWRSLIWSYPGSSPNDGLKPRLVVDDLVRCLKKCDSYSRHAFFYPSGAPCWLHPEFLIKTQVYCVAGEVAFLVLLLPEEYRSVSTGHANNLMPVGILASLLRDLHSLRLVARTADFYPLDRMLRTTYDIAGSHPVRQHLCLDAAVFNPAVPSYLCQSEYRELLFMSLRRTLNILLAVAPTAATKQLANDFSAFSETSAELVDVLESLVELAAKAPQPTASPFSPFKNTLWAYHKAYDLVSRESYELPPYLLHCVQVQFLALADLLPNTFAWQLQVLYQRFSRLQAARLESADWYRSEASPKPVLH